jgi:hypothetical protein
VVVVVLAAVAADQGASSGGSNTERALVLQFPIVIEMTACSHSAILDLHVIGEQV